MLQSSATRFETLTSKLEHGLNLRHPPEGQGAEANEGNPGPAVLAV